MKKTVEHRTIIGPKFSGTAEGVLTRWMSQWNRERAAIWQKLEAPEKPGELIRFAQLWAWKQEIMEVKA